MKKELSPIVLLILSLIVFIPIIAIGLVFNIGKAAYHTLQVKFWKGPIFFITYLLKMLYQIWCGINRYILQTAIFPDLIANAAGGELVEDTVTTEEDTLFGKGDVTLSTALGELEVNNKPLLHFQKQISKLLSKVLDKDHCVASYKRHLHNKTFKLD